MRTTTYIVMVTLALSPLLGCGDDGDGTSSPFDDIGVDPNPDAGPDAGPDTATDGAGGETDGGDGPDGTEDTLLDGDDPSDTSEEVEDVPLPDGDEGDADAALPDGDDADTSSSEVDDGDTGSTCLEPPDDPCDEPGATRCATAGEVVEICAQEDGCLAWVEEETCLTTNLCTGESDICEDGACVWNGESLKTCEATDEQCMANLCNPETGDCEMTTADDFEPCDDGDVCTDGDQCFQGSCQGDNSCPANCGGAGNALVDNVSCGDTVEVTLSDGTDTMDGYGCDGARTGSTGWERTFRLRNTNAFDCDDMAITIELPDPSQKASDYVEIVALSREQGTCWPEDCLGVAFMDDEGRGALEMNLEAGSDWNIVVDGRNGYAGDVRMTVNCCGTNVEAFCGNGIDDDGDGSADCDDPDCQGSSICDFEHNCENDIDDDGDGLTDCEDPDCADRDICKSETDCDNEIDDDDDGLTDCDDPDCDNAIACGGGCPDAVILECGDTLENETLAGGTSEWAGETVPCGSNDAEFATPHGIYGAEIPKGCTAEFVVDASAGSLIGDLVLNGPSCAMDACRDSGGVFFDSDTLSVPTGISPAWLGISSEAGQIDEPFDVTLNCTCDE